MSKENRYTAIPARDFLQEIHKLDAPKLRAKLIEHRESLKSSYKKLAMGLLFSSTSLALAATGRSTLEVGTFVVLTGVGLFYSLKKSKEATIHRLSTKVLVYEANRRKYPVYGGNTFNYDIDLPLNGSVNF